MGAVPRSHLQFWRKTKHEFRIVSNVQILLTRKHKRIVSLPYKRFRNNKEFSLADRTKIGARSKFHGDGNGGASAARMREKLLRSHGNASFSTQEILKAGFH